MFARFPRLCRSVVFLAALFVIVSFTGCWTKSGEAIVIQKDYVPALPPQESPNESPFPTPAEPTPTPPADETESETAKETEGEEVVNETMGPLMDPRASTHEQWIVTVRMVRDLKVIDVRMDQPQWEKIKIDDRVHVTYRQGKYTGTVWSAEIK